MSGIASVKYTGSTPRKWRAKYRQQQKKEVIMKLPKTKLSVKKLIINKEKLLNTYIEVSEKRTGY